MRVGKFDDILPSHIICTCMIKIKPRSNLSITMQGADYDSVLGVDFTTVNL